MKINIVALSFLSITIFTAPAMEQQAIRLSEAEQQKICSTALAIAQLNRSGNLSVIKNARSKRDSQNISDFLLSLHEPHSCLSQLSFPEQFAVDCHTILGLLDTGDTQAANSIAAQHLLYSHNLSKLAQQYSDSLK